jgi:hypothetical protein
MLAAAASGGLFMSSDYGATWSQVTVGTWAGLAVSYSGQYMITAGSSTSVPNQSSLVANTWTQNNVTWTASASSTNSGYAVYGAFNNTTGDGWLCDNVIQRYTAGSTNGNAATTSIQTIGSTAGEWLQIQSSVPLVMTSFAFGIGPNAYPYTATPKTYYIVGSNDGTTWYPIQSGNFTISAFTSLSSYITINTTGTQTLTGNMVGSVATTAYSYSTNAYSFFRLIGTSLMVYGGSSSTTYMEVGEWSINFTSAQSYSTNYGANWTNVPLTGTSYSFSAISGNGQYSLSGFTTNARLFSNYLAGYYSSTYTTPTFTPSLAANINCASISSTGQYMTVLTVGTTNNVYYSTNYGATFTGITVGSAAMTGCSISADGSYITVSNATTVYTLNLNTQGYSVSVGNAAGAVNQGQNAIAIGN